MSSSKWNALELTNLKEGQRTDSSNVGGVLYMSQDTSIQDLRGTMNPVKLEDLDKIAKENPSKLLSNTLMLEPFGATRSDSMRAAKYIVVAINTVNCWKFLKLN